MVNNFSELTFPNNRWYYINNTPYHYWVRKEGDMTVLGLSDFFQKQIGEIKSIEFKSSDKLIEKSKLLAVVKAKNYSAILRYPFSCFTIEINSNLKKNPKLINESPYDKSWLIKVRTEPPLEEQLTDDWIKLSSDSNKDKLKAFIEKEIKNKSLLADDCCPDFLGGSGVTRRRRN